MLYPKLFTEYKSFDFIKKETSFKLDSILHSYSSYVEDDGSVKDLEEFAGFVGKRYFLFEICTDEIMEMFSHAVYDKNYNSLTEGYGFITFLFKKAFFNEQITSDEAVRIHRKYFGIETINKYGYSNLKPTEFILKLTSYKPSDSTEEVEDYVFKTLLEFVQELGY